MNAILVVDDEPAIAALLGKVVQRLGYEPIVVQQSSEVLPAFLKTKPLLAIIDYMLPGLDGGQLFEQMRAMAGGASLPVIFVTAMPVAQLRDRVRDHTRVRFMQKPLDFIALRKNIDELLTGRGI